MDFYQICTKEIDRGPSKGDLEMYPDFLVGRSKDLMVRGRSFYAIWDEEAGLWSTDEYDVQRLVDEQLYLERDRLEKGYPGNIHVKSMRSDATGSWRKFKNLLLSLSDNSHPLDSELTFSNTEVKKSDYVSRRLAYPLEPGSTSAWSELIGTLYSVEERAKIEWAIGAIVAGDAKKIQKFLVLYGPAGTGKSTVLNIIQALFEGYTTSFEAKALGSNNGSFATEVFKSNPLVAIQHDGDLSRIEDNTRLNSIIAHEEMTMNEKFKPSYTSRVNAFLFMGTNQPVKISDAKSGIIRRLIDVNPTGAKLPANHYNTLMSQIDFELGAIAYHCLEVYRSMGKNYYNDYRPTEMMFQTDVFFNFIEAHYDVFKSQTTISIKQAYSLYKEFCADTGIERPLPQYKVREELRNYFDTFKERAEIDGKTVRSVYSGFNAEKFKTPVDDAQTFSLVMDETESLLDELLAEMPAQLATDDGLPKQRWANVKTTLKDLDTSELHYVKVPANHIVIDFDLKGEDGGKSLERNLEAASAWPATYAELSKSGRGVHLHYVYTGQDIGDLSPVYSDGIEVKVYRGDSSLRRKVCRSNAVPVAEISSGLPLKEKNVISEKTIQSERGLRLLIERNLKKEFHPGTKPSVDFIKQILDDVYDDGLAYDVSDMQPRIIAFANNSTNQPFQSLKVVQEMKFVGKTEAPAAVTDDSKVVLFDTEVYPNLFIVCWKYEDSDSVVRMRNPTAQDMETLFKYKLVGFNCRRYDNHILYGRFMGYDNTQLYELSQNLITNNKGHFGEAYNLSYADIYDFSSKKQSLKKFMIELGITKMEMEIPWDQPVPDELVEKVEEYCVNDVEGTEATWKARKGDFTARQILAELSGLTVNDTTARHTAKILFGDDKNASKQFNYTDLSEEFEGYEYDHGKSTYRDEVVGEGGYVYAEPGIYTDVALLDVASMHPTSIEVLDLFGPFTRNFSDLKAARIAIKRGKYAEAKKMLDGRLAPYLGDEDDAEALSYALKIVINIVYGLTSAKFDNPFRDVRNKDNIVAKRGALFMVDLKHFVQELGFTVAHIKTDSIKIPNATPEIIEAVTDFGAQYGYEFEHEGTYDKLALVNDAVYIASKKGDVPNKWEAVGAQFQHPYVYKTLFSHEPLAFDDLCETKQVTKGAMYLDIEGDGVHFIGRIGRFVPVTKESGGGELVRVVDDKTHAVSGTKGFFWMDAEIAQSKFKEPMLELDMSYFEKLADSAMKTIEKFGDFEEFVK